MLAVFAIGISWTTSTLVGILSESEAPDSNFIPRPRKPRQEAIHADTVSEEATLWTSSGIVANGALFCAVWTVNVDDWWSQHPDWELKTQNATHQCFRRILHAEQRRLYERLHAIQFPSSCQGAVIQKHMTGSGWGVDLSHVVDGLLTAVTQQTAVAILAPTPWQFVSGVHGSAAHPACPKADLSCYFLPLTSCTQRDMVVGKPEIRYNHPWRGFAPTAIADSHQEKSNWMPWLLQYATRPQTWLRHEAVRAADTTRLPTNEPCTVVHVRRADVVLHGKFSRRYHAIHEYIEALEHTYGRPTGPQNMLLLTDDANAIQEAIAQYSTENSYYRWFYLERPRHQADAGGWENQIPSGEPVTEVVMLHAAFELAAQCQTLVHSKSNLADYLYAVMLLQDPDVVRIDLDAGRPHQMIHRAVNEDSVRLSTKHG